MCDDNKFFVGLIIKPIEKQSAAWLIKLTHLTFKLPT